MFLEKNQYKLAASLPKKNNSQAHSPFLAAAGSDNNVYFFSQYIVKSIQYILP
jgi:hypothetical protein